VLVGDVEGPLSIDIKAIDVSEGNGIGALEANILGDT
jgi:hypothetical protein